MNQISDFIPNSQYLASQILVIVLDSIINFCAKYQYIGDETLCKPRLLNHVWYEPIIEDYKLRYSKDGNYLIVQYGSTLSGIEPIWYENNHYEPLHQMVKGYGSKYIYNDTSGIESLEKLKSDINSLDIKRAIRDAAANYDEEIKAKRKIRGETDLNDLHFANEQLLKLDLRQKGFISDLDNEAKAYEEYLRCRWALNWLNDVPLEKIQDPSLNQEIKQKKHSILFLSADPTDASRLRLGEEYREIQEKLQLAKFRDCFTLNNRTSIRPADLSQSLLDIEPDFVHFSGHGIKTGELCLEDKNGKIQPIVPNVLANLFENFTNHVKCVILNACYSDCQAKAIVEHIDYVVGMKKSISDEAAIKFAIGFYQAIGNKRSIEDAYKLGCNQIELHGIDENLTPVLYKKSDLPNYHGGG